MYVYETKDDLIATVKKECENKIAHATVRVTNSTVRSHARTAAVAERGAYTNVLQLLTNYIIREDESAQPSGSELPTGVAH